MADTKQAAEGERIAEQLQQTTTPDAGGTVTSDDEDDDEELEIDFIPEDRPTTQ